MSKLAKILGVKDGEVFNLYYHGKPLIGDYKVYLGKLLYMPPIIDTEWEIVHSETLYNVINGDYEIRHKPEITDEDRYVLNHYASYGYRWVTRESNGLYVYKTKPRRNCDGFWDSCPRDYQFVWESKLNKTLCNFIGEDDDEPFYWEVKTNEI